MRYLLHTPQWWRICACTVPASVCISDVRSFIRSFVDRIVCCRVAAISYHRYFIAKQHSQKTSCMHNAPNTRTDPRWFLQSSHKATLSRGVQYSRLPQVDCWWMVWGKHHFQHVVFLLLLFFFGSTILCAYIRVLFRQQYTLYIYMHFFFVPCTGKIKCTHTSGTYSVAVMRVHMRIGYVYSCVSIIFPFICCNPETASNSFFGAQNQRAMTWQMSSLHVYAACVRCCFHCAPSDRALLCVFVYAFRNAHVSECLCLCTGSHERMNLFGLQSSRILLKFRSLSSSQHSALSLSLSHTVFVFCFSCIAASLSWTHTRTHAT